jgi:hypothetical protein
MNLRNLLKENNTERRAAANTRNCCTTTLSHLQILKNDFIKSLLSVLVFELCFFEQKI